jgi:hypothetical protein
MCISNSSSIYPREKVPPSRDSLQG